MIQRKEPPPIIEDKEVYTLKELFDNLPITLIELGRRAHVNEVTVARVRDGKCKPRRDTINKLLEQMSKVYEKRLTLRNVKNVDMSDIEVRGHTKRKK